MHLLLQKHVRFLTKLAFVLIILDSRGFDVILFLIQHSNGLTKYEFTVFQKHMTHKMFLTKYVFSSWKITQVNFLNPGIQTTIYQNNNG